MKIQFVVEDRQVEGRRSGTSRDQVFDQHNGILSRIVVPKLAAYSRIIDAMEE
jgi:hypothetical protein